MTYAFNPTLIGYFTARPFAAANQVSMSKMGNRFWSNQQNPGSADAANVDQTIIIGFSENCSTRNV